MDTRSYLKERIQKEGFKNVHDTLWLDPNGMQARWTFDLKHLFLDKAFLAALCEEFWKIFDKNKPIQIGGMETASIPFITALVLSSESATGFYIRKSKKKKYDLRQVEGRLTDAPVVLVDDVINSGSSIEKQIKILHSYHRDVHAVFSCVRNQPEEHYAYFNNYGARVHTLFPVTEFGGGYAGMRKDRITLRAGWQFKIDTPHTFNVMRRPQIHVREYVYVNADDGYVYALDPYSGATIWKRRISWRIPPHGNQAGITSSSTHVFAGTESGSVYALSKTDGSVLWFAPVSENIAGDIRFLSKYGAVVALGKQANKYVLTAVSAQTGKKFFEYGREGNVTGFTHSRLEEHLYISTSTGELSALHTGTEKVIWTTKLNGSIRDRGTLFEDDTKIAVVTDTSKLYILDTKNGDILSVIGVTHNPWLSAAPVISEGKAYLTSLHRTVYAIDLSTGGIVWELDTRGRTFGQPIVHKNMVLFGNNEGVLYVLDKHSGNKIGSYICTERIVAEPIFDQNAETLFVPTIASEVIALKLTEI